MATSGFTPSLRHNLARTAHGSSWRKSMKMKESTNVGISSRTEAQRHAVINHNPFLGRMTIDGLSVYENGEPQSVFSFPWAVGDSWTFTLFGQEWTASTDSINNGNARVSATSAEGHELSYTFSGSKEFMEAFVWRDGDGVRQLRMDLECCSKRLLRRCFLLPSRRFTRQSL